MTRASLLPARALGLAGLLLVFGGAPDAQATSLSQDCSATGALLSAVTVTGLAVFDIATAPASARRYNERRVSVAPYVDIRRRSYGLSVSWSYGKTTRAPRYMVHSSPAGAGDSTQARKSPGVAFALSLGSTGVPMAVGAAAGGGGAWVLLAGVVVGPSVGHVYAGQVGRGIGTAALRGVGTVAGLVWFVGCFD